MIEVKEMQLDQTNIKNEPQASTAEMWNLKYYLRLKRQLLHNLEQRNTNDELSRARKLDMQEFYIQEIGLLAQLLDKQ